MYIKAARGHDVHRMSGEVLIAAPQHMHRAFRFGLFRGEHSRGILFQPQLAPAIEPDAMQGLDIFVVYGGGIRERRDGSFDARLAQ